MTPEQEAKALLAKTNDLIAQLAAHYGMDAERVEKIRKGEPIYARFSSFRSLSGDCLNLTDHNSPIEKLSRDLDE